MNCSARREKNRKENPVCLLEFCDCHSRYPDGDYRDVNSEIASVSIGGTATNVTFAGTHEVELYLTHTDPEWGPSYRWAENGPYGFTVRFRTLATSYRNLIRNIVQILCAIRVIKVKLSIIQ